MKKDYRKVYDIVENLKDCRCTIKFLNSSEPQKPRSYTFFISEVMYRQSLKELIRHISRRIDDSGQRPKAVQSINQQHLLTIIKAEELKQAEGVKEYVEYDRDGKSLDITIYLAPGKLLDYFFTFHKIYIPKDECYDDSTDTYLDFTL